MPLGEHQPEPGAPEPRTVAMGCWPLAAKGEQPRARGVCEQQQHGVRFCPCRTWKPRGTAQACIVSHELRGWEESLHRGAQAVGCHLPSWPENRLQGFTYCHSSSQLAWKRLAFLSSTLIAYFLTSEPLHDGCSWVKQRLPGLLLP